MKKIITLFAAILLLVVGATAQKLSYQAVVRNDANELVTETTVQVVVVVLDASNAVQYAETHANVQTNRNGLLSLMIGDGISMSSTTLADVVWSGASLRTVITLPDNTTITSVTPVNSVPYALYADNVDPDMVSDAIADYIASHNIGGEDNVQADWNESDQGSDAFIRNKPDIPTVPTDVSAFNNDAGYLTEAQCNGVDICALANLVNALQQQVADLRAQLDSVGLIMGTAITHTVFCCGTSTVTDHEGNVYHTVQIGDQCWMRDNLRTTKYPDGSDIPLNNGRYYPNNDTNNVAVYGYLYTWNAMMNCAGNSTTNLSDEQGICPMGWHVPSDAEWTVMIDHVKGQSEYVCGENYIAKALADSVGWNNGTSTCAVGNNQSANNATGFGALPAGYYSSGYGIIGSSAYFWTSTQSNSSYAPSWNLNYNYAYLYHAGYGKGNGYSVRCLRDEMGGSTATLPTVTTNVVSGISTTSATCGGNVTSDGEASVTTRGVCWSTSQNPTVSNSHTTDGSGLGNFSSSITGLTANTTYYVRAYATNSVGTAYGAEVSFTTSSIVLIDAKSCAAAPTVTDHEGNVYATVQIGDQCWMRDNLRTTTSPSTGTYLIPASRTGYTYTGKQARWYNNDSATYAPMNYGLLYNWNAAVDTFNTTYGELSVNTNSNKAVSVTFNGHRKGICPAGWHLPSDADWNTMEATVSGSDWQTSYETSTDYRGSHAGKLAGGNNWTTSTTSGVPGDYDNADRNVSDFSAVPAGGCYGSSFYRTGNNADFWSSSRFDGNPGLAYNRGLYYTNAGVNRGCYDKGNGYSVRCVRD